MVREAVVSATSSMSAGAARKRAKVPAGAGAPGSSTPADTPSVTPSRIPVAPRQTFPAGLNTQAPTPSASRIQGAAAATVPRASRAQRARAKSVKEGAPRFRKQARRAFAIDAPIYSTQYRGSDYIAQGGHRGCPAGVRPWTPPPGLVRTVWTLEVFCRPMTTTPLRIGIVGAGNNTRVRHIPGLKAMPGVELVSRSE